MKFTEQTAAILKAIHQSWQQGNEQPLPQDDLLQDLEITFETLRAVDPDTMQEMMLNLALADAALFIKLLYS